jgi:hypothetical protein
MINIKQNKFTSIKVDIRLSFCINNARKVSTNIKLYILIISPDFLFDKGLSSGSFVFILMKGIQRV